MNTHYAKAERAADSVLQRDIRYVTNHPVLDGLMTVASGLLAVLNEERQLLSLNESLLDMLGIGEAGEVLGLRLGEAVSCEHAKDMSGGCGTSEYCRTCGAAISIVTALGIEKPVERTCAVATERRGERENLFLRVRCSPLILDDRRYLLLFLQDITHQQRLASLERMFLHDINNIILSLVHASELLASDETDESRHMKSVVHQLSQRLANEVAMQRALSEGNVRYYQRILQEVSLQEILNDLRDTFASHPAAAEKRLVMPSGMPDVVFRTDQALLMRVLGNMIVNAFEATEVGDEVRVSLDRTANRALFLVWNRAAIPADIVPRIFQRNFSTKAEMGRGLGTFSMKLFGEEFLGGEVDFSTSKAEGTVFRFSLEIR